MWHEVWLDIYNWNYTNGRRFCGCLNKLLAGSEEGAAGRVRITLIGCFFF